MTPNPNAFPRNPLLVNVVADYDESIKYDESHISGIQALMVAIKEHAAQLDQKKDRLELARLQVELNDLNERALTLGRIVADKKTHYEETFLPQYRIKLAESNEQFDEVTALMRQAAKADTARDAREEARQQRIRKYLEEYDALPQEMKEDEHIRGNFYHVFRNLLPPK